MLEDFFSYHSLIFPIVCVAHPRGGPIKTMCAKTERWVGGWPSGLDPKFRWTGLPGPCPRSDPREKKTAVLGALAINATCHKF